MTNRCGWLSAWPGLAPLWIRGDARGLLVAIVFAAALNVALVDTFIWPELFELGSPWAWWTGLAAGWAIGFFWAVRDGGLAENAPPSDEAEGDSLFIQAQTEYLSGHWDEAAWILQRRLARRPRDIEARLMLATLFRHQRRLDAAEEQLRVLKNMDESRGWAREIEREAELAREFAAHQAAESANDSRLGDPDAASDTATQTPEFDDSMQPDLQRRAA